MKSFISGLVFYFFTLTSFAGVFGGEQPPKEFLQSEVQSRYGSNTNEYGFTVEKLAATYQDSGKVTWEKDNQSWIMRVDRTNKMTSEKVKIAILLTPTNDKKANISKMTIDKDTLPESAIVNMMAQTAIAFSSASSSPQPRPNEKPSSPNQIKVQKKNTLAKKSQVNKDDDPKLKLQQAEDAARLEKAKAIGEAIKSAIGSYKNSMTDVGDEFSFYMNEGTMFASYKNKKCDFKDKELSFPSLVNGDGLETKLKDVECELSFNFSTLTSGLKAVSVNESESCKKFCSYSDGRSLAGRFQK
ncbi:hypothetical protein K2P97_10130 [bacterium]|nr:hypothetical protein [bacterium]